ncbi:hypothetical protein PSTH1771_01640 [Pseudomonas syringae pv. theae]|uniref:GAD-like domain-containing protein n=1 Tax=Pseudomonas syringae TaxID=317 RepID=UPI001F39F0AA|nr:GAD-like domain-containing protein [Pseudomonas syringae]MBL3831289.1 hypothetical protein [Pseudomonas syringae pv. theae]MBL3834482.1 hypothetical protein [Pseudomonas syringae pv. theae]MBL3865494.1 hypothetical protein [Pseudomonas syringae pv. theae]GKQ45921.1 hypothetical protein PSTH2693_12215 [Pseudomonas syringae pv. theae]GKS03666.1 hypothetical protein PSTH1771_01640 [Pseudomonas syringae pv. theae]
MTFIKKWLEYFRKSPIPSAIEDTLFVPPETPAPAHLQLQAFIHAHPPHADNQHPDAHLLARYRDLLPEALLELWSEHGLGYYGERRLWLLNPDDWQFVLDQWIQHIDDAARRVPILMTPFGTLIYYCKQGEDDESISALSVVEQNISGLGHNLPVCFNYLFTNEAWLDEWAGLADIEYIKQTKGALTAGEIYQKDHNLGAIMSIYKRVDARAMFDERYDERRLCATFDYPSPGILSEALPDVFADEALVLKQAIESDTNNPITGFYLNAYICRYQLLGLMPHGQCMLICWTTHPQTLKSMPPRLYHGRFEQQRSTDGDTLIILAMENEIDGDIATDQVFYLTTGNCAMLIREEDLRYVANAMNWDDSVEHSAHPLRKVGLDYWIPTGEEKLPTPSHWALPVALRNLLRDEPLRVIITSVGEHDAELEDVIVQARIETDSGLPANLNIPLCSPAGNSKKLSGWVWQEGSTHLQIRISTCHEGNISEPYFPAIGDVLISRRQSSD